MRPRITKPILKLGLCQLCKKPVSKRISHSFLGDRPMWVWTPKGVFHKHCWEMHKKSISTKTEITAKLTTPPTPIGTFELEVKKEI